MNVLDALEARMENATKAFCRTERAKTGSTGAWPAAPSSSITEFEKRTASADDRMESATQQFCRTKPAKS